ncbi:hypothetical protein YC2023_012256 [Brassica napus]
MDLHVSSLPWELEEEILSRLPPESLVRFRAVSKRWNSLLNNKSFIKKHLSLSRPHFIFLTKSKIFVRGPKVQSCRLRIPILTVVDHKSFTRFYSTQVTTARELRSTSVPLTR